MKKYFLCLIICLVAFCGYSHEYKKNDSLVIINDIVISGNKKTKTYIVERELVFKKGETLKKNDLTQRLIQSKQNLFNTSLFNFISINTIEETANKLTIFILLEERWYLFPYPILEYADRNFSAFLQKKNWRRINYGLMFTHHNFRGRAEKIKIKFRFGYKEQIQLEYQIPYIGKEKKHHIGFEYAWYRQKEVAYKVQNDKLIFLRNNNDYLKKYQTLALKYQYRNKHYIQHQIKCRYTHANVADTLVKLNPNYFGGKQNNTQFFSLSYALLVDKRDYKFYPLTGYNFFMFTQKKGFGIIDKDFLQSWDFNVNAYQYLQIGKRFYAGIGTSIQLTKEDNGAFFNHQTLGYTDYLRAYEYYVIDGRNYLSTHTFIKYALIPMNIKYIPKWNWDKFNKIHYSLFVNLFFDSGYAYKKAENHSNKLPNEYQYSIGIGLDLVAYYDNVFRLEYSINKHKQYGFFIHINKAF